MRILIHSNAPWVPSGYGKQAAHLMRQLNKAGHEVACSAFSGLGGAPITWEEMPVYPSGMFAFGKDVLLGHANDWEADLIFTLCDFWKFTDMAEAFRGHRLAVWLPNDCTPLSVHDRSALARAGAYPIAMSRFGQRNLLAAGWPQVPYMPHAVDCSVFTPPQDRMQLRAEAGIGPDRFVVGICSANSDAVRKGWPEQLNAFGLFRERHPEALLMIHSVPRSPSGLDLQQMCDDMGLTGSVMFSDHYAQVAGMMGDGIMAEWFGALDVLLSCSYAEAFGVPLIEAQACGTPVIATYGSAMTENRGSGFNVLGSRFWNPVHRAWWDRPDPAGIVGCLEEMHKLWKCGRIELLRTQAETWAQQYHVAHVAEESWLPTIERLEHLQPSPRPE